MFRKLLSICCLLILLALSINASSQHKGTVTDIDGNEYPTVVIGTQEWMAKNLRASKFSNGDEIPNAQSVDDWTSSSFPLKWANYNNSAENDAIYGKLYDGRVVNDARNVCPTGWHVATKDEWDELLAYLGGTSIAANKLMDSSGSYWASPNDATNESGFTAVPNGYRASDGSFLSLTYTSEIWTSTAVSSISNNYVYIHYSGSISVTDGMTYGTGRAVRCIKNAEVLVPTVTTNSITDIAQTTATAGGNVTSDGGAEVTARGVCWSTSENPTVADSKTEDGSGTGEFNSSITGLTASTTYYVRAYATNSAGTAYGEQKVFTTTAAGDSQSIVIGTGNYVDQRLPIEPFYSYSYTQSIYLKSEIGTSGQISSLKYYFNGNSEWTDQIVVYMGHTDQEVFSSPSDWIPMENLTQVYSGDLSVTATAGWVTISLATPFTYNNSQNLVIAVDENTSGYHSGSDDFYCTDMGLVRSIFFYNDYDNPDPAQPPTGDLSNYIPNTTLTIIPSGQSATAPTVSTTTVTSITQTSAISGGTISDDGGADITAKGVVWGTVAAPTLEANTGLTNDGSGTDGFSSELTGLTANTTYYVRAYATNSAGTGYGEELQFTTQEEYTGETVTDIDGNIYPVVEIGTQKWMGQNLRVTKFNDNTSISYPGSDNTAWEANSTGAYAWYDNNEINKSGYGALYNWYAVQGNKLCPTGWHVPSNEEWVTLIEYLGGAAVAGGKLKAAGTEFWNSSSAEGTNESGFAAVGGGNRWGGGNFASQKVFGMYWTTDISEYDTPISWYLWYNGTTASYGNYDKNDGFSVRCIMDPAAALPTITTSAVTSISQTSAISGGNISADGGASVTARGVVWSTSENPSISDSKTEDGTGTGEFTSEIAGLSSNTTYYVRAYATNSAGTAYGQQVIFTTEAVDEVINLPFAEGFEETAFPPTGWVKFMGENGLGTVKEWERATSTSSEGSASAKSVYESVTAGMRGQDWLVTPKIQLADANNYLTFYEKDEFSGNYNSTFRVLISSTSQTSHAAFTELASYDESSLSYNAWSKREINLDSYAGQAVYIAFVHEQNFGDTWFIDDISVISEAPTVYFAGGQGTQADPWQIGTPDHLNNVRNFLGNDHSDKYFVQIADINLGQAPWNTGEGWVPIGGETGGYFTAHYDGADYSISGLFINRPNVNYQGLFGMVQNGAIKNVNLLSANVTGEGYVGALLGWSSMVTIEGCSAESIVVGEGDYAAAVGGLAGYNHQTTMSGCSSNSTVTGDYFVGGLVGNTNESTYTECFSSGDVTGTVEEAGGLIGRNYTDTSIDQCYSTANVTGKTMVGGLVGSNVSSSISSSYATGSIVNSGSGSGFGGFVGNNQNTSTITNCYSIGLVNSTTYNSGGFSGTNSATISSSYWNTATSGKTESTGGTGLSTSQLLAQASFSGWDFTTVWDNIADVTYPYLRWQGGPEAHNYPEVSVPVVSTMDITNITQTSASSGGSITNDGGASITAKGVVWSTSQNPTLDDSKTENGSGTAEFTSEISGLTANTTYYVRAYATNSAGTGYGDQKSFTTTATGVDIESLASVGIFPNPFTSNLNINSERGIKTISVTSISGQVLLVKELSGELSYRLEIVDIEPGLYILSVIEVDGTKSRIRIIKR
ncbi:MAG: FISUMP domain-containing protein [Tenuifilaceae bacterium]|jgi:uncharacterized protein (TIGR02145 family)|nr:FISUMP domain-containing protein [Tenuifilaceae bacterium]